jgi:subtilisin family serine protease
VSVAFAKPKPTRYRAGEFIVKLKNPNQGSASLVSGIAKPLSLKAQSDFKNKAQRDHGFQTLDSWDQLNMHHMRINDSHKSVEESIAEIQALPEVEYAEPNYIVDKLDDPGPVSSAYTLAQVLSFIGFSFGMTSAAIQAQPTWPILTGTQNSVVAIIDTGVDYTHTSFTNAMWTNTAELNGTPGVDDDHNGYVDDIRGWNFAYNNNNPFDDEGHGTHVAGIVLGVSENIFAVPAATTNIQIMPLKFLDSTGSGTTADAIKAIYYAANNGARVMNNSWGGGGYSVALAEAITYSYYKDILFVVAAGNASNNNDANPTYPASYQIPNVISVAASDDNDSQAYFSNYGTHSVHLASPGINILSTYPGGLFAYLSGTSMASPFVAGVAGMMRHESPTMNCYQVKNLLLATVDTKSNLAPYVQTSGRLNVYSAVNSAKITTVDPYKPNFLLTVNPADRGLSSAIANRGGGCGLVSVVGKSVISNDDNDPQNRIKQVIITLALLLLPLVIVTALRTPEKASNRRRFDRYAINSSVTMKFGEKELVGAVKTISVGGTEINTDALLKEGSIITMQIISPDGKTKIDVQGHIVWSEQEKRYGVAFDEVADAIKSQIVQWSRVLTKV